MPLFVFLSGYFSQKKNKKDLWTSIWKLLKPYIVCQLIAMTVDFIMTGKIKLYYILNPWWAMWYLFSLVCWRIMIYIIPNKILNNVKLMLFYTINISLFAGFIPIGGFLSIQRTLSFMPFFFSGYCMNNNNINLPKKKKYKLLSFIFLFMMKQ